MESHDVHSDRTLPASSHSFSHGIPFSTVAWILLAFLPALIVRFAQPTTFPAFFCDESLFNQGPKNFVLLGDPLAFVCDQVFLSPGHFIFAAIAFYVFGPNLAVARIMAGIFGVGTIFFTYLLGRQIGGARIGLFAALLCAYNSMLIYSSRIATLEPEVIFFMLGTVYFWLHENPKRIWLSGIFLAAALLAKLYAVFLIPILLAGTIFIFRRPEAMGRPWFQRLHRWHWISLMIALVIASCGFYILYQWDNQRFLQVWLDHTIRRVGELGKHPLHFLRDFVMNFPEMIVISVMGMVLSLRKRLAGWWFLFFWLIIGYILITLQVYRPSRYYFQFIPILAFFAAYALAGIPRGKGPLRFVREYLLATICLIQIVHLIPHYHYGRSVNNMFKSAAQVVESETSPDEMILMFEEHLILFRRLTVALKGFESPRGAVSTVVLQSENKSLPNANYIVLTDDKLISRRSQALIRQMESEHFFPYRRFGYVQVFKRGRSDQTVKIEIPKCDIHEIQKRPPLD